MKTCATAAFGGALCLFSLAIFSPLLADTTSHLVITKNLSYGMTDGQVITLQKILNSNPATHVAASGPGSPGNETAYFGSLTRSAVIKFQNLYPLDILSPAGLSQGNGFVGPLTIKKLNQVAQTIPPFNSGNSLPPTITFSKLDASSHIDMYASDKKVQAIQDDIVTKINAAINSRTAPSINMSAYQALMSPVIVTNASAQTAKPGATVVIAGRGFDPNDNTIYFGPDYALHHVPAAFASTLSFAVPRELPAGKYDIAISNKNGLSMTMYFVVQPPQSVPVEVTSIIPQKVNYGSQLTLTGTGFTPTDNDIYTTYGKIASVSSPDGKTLTFTYGPTYISEIAKNAIPGSEYQSQIVVVNANGVSAFKIFTLVL